MEQGTAEKKVVLSIDQREAVEKIAHWFTNEPEKQYFALAGYAGTGKTTVISRMIADLGRESGVDVTIGAPTGKAAFRLRQKGVNAETIHALAYRFRGKDKDGNLEFAYRGMGKNEQRLIVIDEASMVDKRIFDDLLSGGYRILFVGDHGQLPPVGEDPGIMRNPDFTLSVIHRQDDEGLLDFAHALREGAWQPKASGAVETMSHYPNPDGSMRMEVIQKLASADTAICWKNETRHRLNYMILGARGLLPCDAGPYVAPVARSRGDDEASRQVRAIVENAMHDDEILPMVCLRNNNYMRIYNGQVSNLRVAHVGKHYFVAVIVEDAEDGESCQDSMRAVSVIRDEIGDDPMRECWIDYREIDGLQDARVLRVLLDGLRGDPRDIDVPMGRSLFDFGLCLTAHKSQGSEWDHVCVYDDTFRTMKDRARWAYTAATRAKKQLTWMRG